MRLRDANVQDAPAIADLWNPIIRDTLNTFTTEEKTIIALETAISAAGLENRGYFIAEDAVGLLGFCTYFQFRGGPGYRHTMEHSIILAPRAMRQGIGRQSHPWPCECEWAGRLLPKMLGMVAAPPALLIVASEIGPEG